MKLADENTHIEAILLVGSYARKEEHDDSDIDLMIITDKKESFIDDEKWLYLFGKIKRKEKEKWGDVTSIRAYYENNEYEFSVGNKNWINLPLDAGSRKVLSDGYVILYDRNNIMKKIKCLINENNIDRFV